MNKTLFILALSLPLASTAQETRQLDAHEHGHSTLDIAVEENRVALTLEAPGFDIVGFEYEASTAEDRAKIDAAIATLSQPLSLFVMPAAAACTVVSASAGLVDETGDHDHDHDHDHAAHEEAEHEHSHEAQKEAGHDHNHDDEHDHEEASSHTEFHADYMLDCANPSALDRIEFAFFDAFPNAEEVDVQLISDSGADAFEVGRDAPVLDLAGRI